MSVNLIAAIGKRGQIGTTDHLPWQEPNDMQWFREQTNGGIIVFGHRTYVSLTHKKFPGRLVCNFERHHDPERFLKDKVQRYAGWPVWIAGGRATYEAFAPFVDGLKLISFIDYDNKPEHDDKHVFFPFDAYKITWR